MNDNRLDDRIRELYAELSDAAPEAPPLPVPEPARRVAWLRPAALAAAGVAVVALVLGVAAVFLTQLDGADDSADAAAPTTSAPAATAAPATTVVPGETFAPVTTSGEAADDGGEPGGTPRPVDRILLLAELNRACTAATERFDAEIPAQLDTEDDLATAFGVLFDEFEEIRRIMEDAAAASGDGELAMLADEIMQLQGSVVMGGEEPLRPRYPDAVAAAGELGELLADLGASDCAGLSAGLP